jgi:hypothetical protein
MGAFDPSDRTSDEPKRRLARFIVWLVCHGLATWILVWGHGHDALSLWGVPFLLVVAFGVLGPRPAIRTRRGAAWVWLLLGPTALACLWFSTLFESGWIGDPDLTVWALVGLALPAIVAFRVRAWPAFALAALAVFGAAGPRVATWAGACPVSLHAPADRRGAAADPRGAEPILDLPLPTWMRDPSNVLVAAYAGDLVERVVAARPDLTASEREGLALLLARIAAALELPPDVFAQLVEAATVLDAGIDPTDWQAGVERSDPTGSRRLRISDAFDRVVVLRRLGFDVPAELVRRLRPLAVCDDEAARLLAGLPADAGDVWRRTALGMCWFALWLLISARLASFAAARSPSDPAADPR